MLEQPDVVAHFMRARRNAGKDIRHTRIQLSGIGLSRYRVARVKIHLLRDHRIDPVDRLFIPVKQFHEARLRTGRAL